MKKPAILFYTKDWLTDINLQSCSISAQGLWIKLMCIMHGSDEYGKILLKQMFNEIPNLDYNLSWINCKKLAGICGLTVETFTPLITELLTNNVARIDDFGNMYSKRMINDENLSIIRKEAGGKGGKKTAQQLKKLSKKKIAKANLENVNENVNESKNENDYENFISTYSSWHKTVIGIPAKISGADGKAMKDIITYLSSATKDTQSTGIKALKFILDNYSRWNKFHQNQTKLTQINYNLTNILNSIKNGNSNSNSQSASLEAEARRTAEELASFGKI